MANVQVIQRNAHLAGAIRLEFVNGREGKVAKGTVTAISNTRWGSGEARNETATAIQWILWGAQAENAAEYLGKGSHVNVVGRVRNNNYQKNGETVYSLEFTVEDLDYLDSRADAQARRSGGRGPDADAGQGGGQAEGFDERGQRDDESASQTKDRKTSATRSTRRTGASEA